MPHSKIPLSAPGGGGPSAQAEHYRRQLETVANNATLALFIMDEKQHCTYMNPAAEELTGFSLHEVQGKPLHDYVHHTRPDGSPYPLEECPIDQAFPQNLREQGEEVFVHRDGHFYPVAFTASPILDGDRPVGTIIEVRDITEEKREASERARMLAERERLLRELDAERARLQQVFVHAPALISVTRGAEHVFEMVNPAYQRFLGDRELLGRPVREALPELAGQGYLEMRDAVYATGESHVQNEACVLADLDEDGVLEEHFLNFVTQPLRSAAGEVDGILTFAVDVTEQVHARRRVEEQAGELEALAAELQLQAHHLEQVQAELEASNADLQQANRELAHRTRAAELARSEAESARALLDAFFEAAPVAAAVVGPDLRYQRVNAALAAIDAVDPQAVIGRTLREVVPHFAGRLEPYYRQVLATGEPIRGLEIVGPRPGDPDTEGSYLVNYFPVRASGAVVAVGLVALDVTERRAAENARREEARIVETLHQIGQSLASELDVDVVVQGVTDAATSLTGAQFGAFFYNVVGEDGEAYSLYTISGVPREAFSRFPMPRNTPIFEPTFHGRGVIRSDDVTQDPRYGTLAPHFGMPEGHLPVRSYLAVPVISRTGAVLGGLFFGHPEAGRFTERHERLAVGIAAWAAVAMDNARLYRAERMARSEAERANRVKSEFLATMSHELRTPLNAMIGYTDLLLEGVPEPLPAGSVHSVERIGISARHLLALIEEILSFSRLEAGEETVHPEEIALGAFAAEVRALTEPLALQKGLRLEFHLPDEPCSIESDPRKLRQILVNLIGNAIKFTDTGEVAVTLLESGEGVIFRIADTGLGIAEEDLERIFEPFWQVDGGATRTGGGTGLGLSVTRRLAGLLGGEVSVTSRLRAGTTFTVRIPSRVPDRPAS